MWVSLIFVPSQRESFMNLVLNIFMEEEGKIENEHDETNWLCKIYLDI